MNCQEFERIVLALARDPDAPALAAELAHAEACVHCAARLAEEQALLFGVRTVNADLAKEEAPARVEIALRAAFRAQTAASRAGFVLPLLPMRWRQPGWRLSTSCALALLLLLSLGSLWLKSRPGAPQQDAKRPPQINPTPPKDAIAPREDANASLTRTRRARPRRAPVPVSEAPPPFYPLVEEGEMVPLESGRVVRVEVPAATLIPFGVSLTAEAMAQPVQADLLLGQDGLARAIRFLPANQTAKMQ